jgi:hypothetical protein
MKRLFQVGEERHERGPAVAAWQPEGNLLATAGKNGEPFVEMLLICASSRLISKPRYPCWQRSATTLVLQVSFTFWIGTAHG